MRDRRYRRYIGHGLGAILIVAGLAGLLADARDTRPAGWLLWFAGVVVAHDLVLVPAVLAVGWAVRRAPEPYRGPLRAALIVAGGVSLTTLPIVLALGRRADNPSQLPLPYGVNLLMVVAIIGLIAGAAGLRNARRARASAPPQGRDPFHTEE